MSWKLWKSAGGPQSVWCAEMLLTQEAKTTGYSECRIVGAQRPEHPEHSLTCEKADARKWRDLPKGSQGASEILDSWWPLLSLAFSVNTEPRLGLSVLCSSTDIWKSLRTRSDHLSRQCKVHGRWKNVVNWSIARRLPKIQGIIFVCICVCGYLLFHFLCCSVAKSCLTPCDPMDCNPPGFPVLHDFPELVQIHVHQVGDAIQPSHPLLSPSPPALNLSQHQGLFQWVSFLHQLAKGLEFQFQHQSFQLFRTDFL